MRQTSLSITIKRNHTCFDIIPDLGLRGLKIEVLRCAPIGSVGGHSLVIIQGPHDLDEIELAKIIVSKEGVCQYSFSRIGPGKYQVLVVNKACGLSKAVAESNCFLESASSSMNNNIIWNILAPDADSINALVKKIEEKGLKVKIISTHEQNLRSGLTFHQRRALQVAFEMGFFDIPQRTTLDILAVKIGCSKSTLDVILRRAERKLVSSYLSHGLALSELR